MNHLHIQQTNRDIYIPENLAECDYRQYIEMAQLIFRYQCQEISYNDLLVQGLYKLINMKAVASGIQETEKFSNIYQKSLLLNSFFDKDGDKRIIKLDFNHNPIPKFFGTVCNYYGPSDEFNNVKFGEYVDGLGYFIDFNDTGEVKYLYYLLAVFYRPRKSFIGIRKRLNRYYGDERIKYNPATVEERANGFAFQNIGILYGFYLLFASFQKYMTTCSIYVEGKEIDMSVLFNDIQPSGYKESGLPGLGMKSLMYSFAESSVFGDLDKLRETPLWEVLVRMYDLYKKNKDFEANQPKK